MYRRLIPILLCACLLAPVARADSLPYGGYASSPYVGAAPTPVGYDVAAFLSGVDMGAGAFSKPEDMYFDAMNDILYIADTGNKRVVAVSGDMLFLREYKAAGGEAFASPKGVFADGKGHVYVADDALGKVFMLSVEGHLIQTYERPVSDLYEETVPFAPQKVVADSAGRVYALSQGVYQGLVCFHADGAFMKFFGANHVEVTAKVALQKLLRVFMTREQRSQMESFIPIEYSNVDIDLEDMVFASVGTVEQSGGYSVYKLNPLGAAYRKFAAGPLTDALADENGVYTCLMRDTKEIVEFSEGTTTGILLTCGGGGSQKGLFQDPVAIVRRDGDILALDRQNGMVTRFTPTEFGKLVHEAVGYVADGRYQEAVDVFFELLKMNSNYLLAYRGLGKAYYEMERYEEAMHYSRLAFDRQGYSDAFKEYSTGLIRDNMAWALPLAAALVIALNMLSAKRRKRGRVESSRNLRPYRHPFHCMTHAYSGFDGVKSSGTGSLPAALTLMGLLFLSSVVGYVLTGFAYNPNRIERLNVLLLMAGSLGSFSLFYLASLAVSSLMSECEGKPKELFIVEAYSLLPFIIGSILTAVATNFLSLEAQPFVVFFQAFMIGWSVVMLFVGMMQINRLTVKKTLLYLFLVILALAIVLVLLVLFYSLVKQFAVFLQTLYSEIMYRM